MENGKEILGREKEILSFENRLFMKTREQLFLGRTRAISAGRILILNFTIKIIRKVLRVMEKFHNFLFFQKQNYLTCYISNFKDLIKIDKS